MFSSQPLGAGQGGPAPPPARGWSLGPGRAPWLTSSRLQPPTPRRGCGTQPCGGLVQVALRVALSGSTRSEAAPSSLPLHFLPSASGPLGGALSGGSDAEAEASWESHLSSVMSAPVSSVGFGPPYISPGNQPHGGPSCTGTSHEEIPGGTALSAPVALPWQGEVHCLTPERDSQPWRCPGAGSEYQGPGAMEGSGPTPGEGRQLAHAQGLRVVPPPSSSPLCCQISSLRSWTHTGLQKGSELLAGGKPNWGSYSGF